MFTRDKPAETPAAAPSKAIETSVAPKEPAPSVQAPVRPQEPGPSTRSRPPSEPSRISAALKVTGQLESDEDIQVDGHVEGDIRARKVFIGAGATVKGTVSGEDVELSGTVTGKIEATSVVLSKSARMSGDVVHVALQIEKGAYIDGYCRPQVQSDIPGSVPGTPQKEKKREDKP